MVCKKMHENDYIITISAKIYARHTERYPDNAKEVT